MKRGYRLLLLSSVLLLAGCKTDLYSNLSETDANQMLALLASNQIGGDKRTDKDGGLVLQVEKSDFVKAVEVLRQNGYPHRTYRSVDELFPSGQLVSSPAQEQAKIRFLREQSLERMLSNIEGVISANVVIADGDNEDVTRPSPESSASVLIKYSPEVNLRALSSQLKNLIHHALPGVNEDHISLVVQAVDYRFDATHKTTGVLAATPQNESNTSSVTLPELPPAAEKMPSSSVKKAGFIGSEGGTGLFALLVFWLVSMGAVIWHGLRKNRKSEKTGTDVDGE